MNHAIGNLMRICGLTLAEALQAATTNPARLIRLAGRANGLVPLANARLTWSYSGK